MLMKLRPSCRKFSFGIAQGQTDGVVHGDVDVIGVERDGDVVEAGRVVGAKKSKVKDWRNEVIVAG